MILEMTDKGLGRLLSIVTGGTGGAAVGVKLTASPDWILTITWHQAMDIVIAAFITGVIGGLGGWLIHLLLNWIKKQCQKILKKSHEKDIQKHTS